MPVIFEPFISVKLTETLIWRKGEHLWNTPSSLISTLVSLTERTQSDMIFPDIRGLSVENKVALLSALDSLSKTTTLGAGIICESSDVEICEGFSGVDCICVYGDAVSKKLPIVRMDGSVEDAIIRGDKAWYCPVEAEYNLDNYGDKIRIIGGLGVNEIVGGSPVGIYSRVESLREKYGNRWACGSGGCIPDDNYLELISLLGAFARIR